MTKKQRAEYMNKWYATKADKEKVKKRVSEWQAKNPEKAAGYRHKWQANNRAAASNYQRQLRYRKQGLVAPYPPPDNCEACGISFGKMMKGPCLDHCHLTGAFRGWLCTKCNSALGLAGDTPEAVQKLLNYIVQAYESINRRLLE